MGQEGLTKENCDVETLADGVHYFNPETQEEIEEFFEPNETPEEPPTDDWDPFSDVSEEDEATESADQPAETDEGDEDGDADGAENGPQKRLEDIKDRTIQKGKEEAKKEAEEFAKKEAKSALMKFLASNPYAVAITVLVVVVIGLVICTILATINKGGSSALNTSTGSINAPRGAEWPNDVVKKGRGWGLKDNTDYSAYSCAVGSTDEGIYTHPVAGFTIRKCKTSIGVVASIISQRALDMITAAKIDGITLRGSGFRTYEEQQSLYAHNCSSGSCHPPTAPPGRSQHERGLASDIWNSQGGILKDKNDPIYIWLTNNAANFGYINLPTETWHWSMSGN